MKKLIVMCKSILAQIMVQLKKSYTIQILLRQRKNGWRLSSTSDFLIMEPIRMPWYMVRVSYIIVLYRQCSTLG